MKKIIITLGLLSTFNTALLAETILSLGTRSSSDIDTMPANQVGDTLHIQQDTTPFTKKITTMSAEEQLEYDRQYNEKFFEPWNFNAVTLGMSEKTWQFKYAKETTYRKDGSLIPKSWYTQQIQNSNFGMSDSLSLPAITLKHSNLRLYPSNKGIYYDPRRTGEGISF